MDTSAVRCTIRRWSEQGVAEGLSLNEPLNSGMSDEEIIQQFGKSAFDRLQGKYGTRFNITV